MRASLPTLNDLASRSIEVQGNIHSNVHTQPYDSPSSTAAAEIIMKTETGDTVIDDTPEPRKPQTPAATRSQQTTVREYFTLFLEARGLSTGQAIKAIDQVPGMGRWGRNWNLPFDQLDGTRVAALSTSVLDTVKAQNGGRSYFRHRAAGVGMRVSGMNRKAG